MLNPAVFLQRYVFNLNALALAVLALQNAGYLVLMGYAQQLQMAAAAEAQRDDAAAPVKKFIGSHFLVTTELMKLLFSTLWCVVDEVLVMRQDGDTTQLIESAEHPKDEKDWDDDKNTAGSTPSYANDSAMEMPFQKAKAQDRQWSDVTGDEELSGPVPLHVLLCRRRFLVLLMCRMRPALGLDRRYKEALLMVVPAIVYAIQGILLIHALKLLDPTMFQVLYQVRILFTAVMLRAVLGLRLSVVRWLALVVLMLGITMTQIREQSDSPPPAAGERVGLEALKHWSLEGTLAALAGAFLSAFSGVFMEFVLKKRGNHFHVSARNVHLALFSVVYFAGVFLREIIKSDETSDFTQRVGDFCWTFFDGFTGLVWFLVVLQALGGMLVAVVVRYCDNIVKAFSTASAIVLSGTASVFLFDLPLSVPFVAGSLLVMTSITVYGLNK